MRLAPLLLSFKGRIDRGPYVFVAAPILILFALRPLWAGWWLPILFARLGFPATSLGSPFVAVVLASYLLLIPLLAVSYKRLHDLRLRGFWSIPYVISIAPVLLVVIPVLAGARPLGLRDIEWLRWIVWVSFYYGLALALALAFIPARRSDRTSEPPSI